MNKVKIYWLSFSKRTKIKSVFMVEVKTFAEIFQKWNNFALNIFSPSLSLSNCVKSGKFYGTESLIKKEL